MASSVGVFGASFSVASNQALTTFVAPLAVDLSPMPHVIAPSRRLRRAARAALKGQAPVQLLEPVVHDLGPTPRRRPRVPFVDRICVVVSSLDAASLRAIDFAKRLGATDVVATHIAIDPAEAEQLADAWPDHIDVPLDVHEAPFRHFGASLADYLTSIRTGNRDEVVIVVIPEVITKRRGLSFLHSHTTRAVRRALLPEPGVAIVTVPFRVDNPKREADWSLANLRDLPSRHAEEER